MSRWIRIGPPIAAAVLVGLAAVVFLPQSWPPSPSPAPTRDWAECVATDPRACTTFDGVALGRYEGSVSLDTPPCDACDAPGTALAAFERLDPHHKPLRAIDRFGPDLHVFCGDLGPCAGPTVEIIVLTFADDSTRPIVVFCPAMIGATCYATDHYGPPYPLEPLVAPTRSEST